jgi:hypothetical protein
MPKDSTVRDLDQLHGQAKSARSRLEPVWLMNLAYYVGDQWLAWDGRQLYSPALRRSRITIVDNRIQPVVRTEVAKMTKNRPVWVVTPRTADDADGAAAQMGGQIMQFMWAHLGMGAKVTKALLWSRICGAGFLKTFWDPTLGDGVQVLVGPDNNPIQDAAGRPMQAAGMDTAALSAQMGAQITAKQVNQGDVALEVRSPFQMFCDPIADIFTDCEWVIEESIKSTEHVLRQYGVELPADTAANPGIVESRMAGGAQTGSGGYKGVRVREYWAGRSSANPAGKRMVWAGQKILLEDDHPFDTLPYVMLKGIEVPGRLWPGSIVEQLRGPQTELNKVKSQIAENRNRVGNPTIAAAKQSVQDPDKFQDSMTMPGGVYFYDDTGTPNAVPVFMQAPQLPAYVLQEIDRIETSIQEIAGQHEVTSANVPPGVTAASAISLLMDADDTRLGPAVTDFETELGELGRKVLTLVADGYTDTRAIRLAGENDAWEIFDFKGAMLSGNTHVEVQAGSAFPQNKAEKQAAMQDLLTFFVQSGNAPHGRQLAQFLRDWGVGGADRLLEDFSRDETQVNRENQRLGMGTPVPINEFDNDQAHLDGHEDFQKTMRYETLPSQAQAAFVAHVAAHRARLANQQAAFTQLQQPGAGGAPAPPGPAGPPPSPTQGA